MRRACWTSRCNVVCGAVCVFATAAKHLPRAVGLANRGKRMWLLGKAHEEGGETITVARSAVQGKPRRDLLKDAIKTLLADGQADRVGAWGELTEGTPGDSSEASSFRGIVAEREGDATPAEWSRLSPEPPLPAELLVGLRPVEQELGESPDDPMIGALVEMRHVLWVPVRVHGHLRGVLFAGRRKRQAPLPRATLESVAAELALAMELEDERRLGRERHEDSRGVLAALASSQSPIEILASIVKDCTNKEAHRSDLGAVFAAIGRFVDSSMTRKEPARPEACSIYFAWHSGDAAWIRALDSDPLSGVWRRAIESHRVAGSEPGAVWSHGDVARVMAFPLEAAGESLGVFVAGIRRDSASPVAVERLELRAALANSALLRQKQSRSEERRVG